MSIGGSSPKKGAVVWALFIIVGVAGILSMPREEYTGDPQAVRCETVSLIKFGTLEIPAPIATGLDNGYEIYFFTNPSDHKHYSKYGILNSLLYVPVLLAEEWRDGHLTYFASDRAIYLNWFNILLTVASAWYLYLIAARYTASQWVAVIYVLTALYCTFWWNYLRAQNSDMYQTMFLLGLYYHLTLSNESGTKNRDRIIAGAYLAALILVKVFFLILVPIALFFEFAVEWRRLRNLVAASRAAMWVAVPAGCAVGALLLVNTIKFGAPLDMGYRMLVSSGHDTVGLSEFTGDFFAGMHGFLLERRHSIFLYFPILAFALFGYRSFYREHRIDCLLFLTIGVLALLLCAKLGDWVGGWGYGPRYMLPYLPLLSLPFIKTVELTSRNWRRWWAIVLAGGIAVALCWSFKIQMEVNSVPFFAYYRLQSAFTALRVAEVDSYFDHQTFGGLAADLLAYRNGKPWRVLELAKPILNEQGVEHFTEITRENAASNYYFWPDASQAQEARSP